MKTSLVIDKGIVEGDWPCIDLNNPEAVQVRIDQQGKTLWVNVNGRMMFRACMIQKLEVEDERHQGKQRNVIHGE